MSESRETGHKRKRQALLTGIGGVVLLVVALIVDQPFLGLIGILMTGIGVEGGERGVRIGICGMVLIIFGLVFHEPFRAFIGSTMTLIGIIMWRAGTVRRE